MVTMEAIQRGIANYVDKELIPKMPMNERIFKGGLIGIYLKGLPKLANTYLPNLGLDKIGIIDENGIDIDAIAESYIHQIEINGGNCIIKIPLIGDIGIDSEEVRKIVNEIKGGA